MKSRSRIRSSTGRAKRRRAPVDSPDADGVSERNTGCLAAQLEPSRDGTRTK
jgi:hypothetical protein